MSTQRKALFLQPREVLADRHFGDGKMLTECGHRHALLFLQYADDLLTPLGGKEGRLVRRHFASVRFAPSVAHHVSIPLSLLLMFQQYHSDYFTQFCFLIS